MSEVDIIDDEVTEVQERKKIQIFDFAFSGSIFEGDFSFSFVLLNCMFSTAMLRVRMFFHNLVLAENPSFSYFVAEKIEPGGEKLVQYNVLAKARRFIKEIPEKFKMTIEYFTSSSSEKPETIEIEETNYIYNISNPSFKRSLCFGDRKHCNILVFGERGSGKSSYINSLERLLTIGNDSRHFIADVRKILFYFGEKLTLSRFYDIWGLTRKNWKAGFNYEDLILGKLPHGWDMGKQIDYLTKSERRRITMEGTDSEVDLVLYVIKASTLMKMRDLERRPPNDDDSDDDDSDYDSEEEEVEGEGGDDDDDEETSLEDDLKFSIGVLKSVYQKMRTEFKKPVIFMISKMDEIQNEDGTFQNPIRNPGSVMMKELESVLKNKVLQGLRYSEKVFFGMNQIKGVKKDFEIMIHNFQILHELLTRIEIDEKLL